MARPSSAPPSRSRAAPRKARTREAILAAAARCFSQQGFVACSMDAISEAAGVSKPTLYAHFGSKEELFDTLLRETVLAAKDEPLPPAATLDEVAAALFALADAHLATSLVEPQLGLLRATAAEIVRRPAWAEEMLASAHDDDLPGWLASLAKTGLLEVRHPVTAAEMFWSLVKGQLFFPVVLGLRGPPTTRERTKVLREAVRIFVAAHTPGRGS